MYFLDKLERKIGWLKIPNLMLYLSIGTLIVYVFDILFVLKGIGSFSSFLAFNSFAIMHGEVWRLFTFLLIPPTYSPLWLAVNLYFYYFIGRSLEVHWGSFRFTVYYLLGLIGSIITGFICKTTTVYYLNMSLFFAFAALFPDLEVLFFFVIPLKVKYLGFLNAAFFLYAFVVGSIYEKVAILMALLNFFIFFGASFIGSVKRSILQKKRQREFQDKMNQTWRS